MPTFREFRDGLGGRVCRGLKVDISEMTTWGEFKDAVIQANDQQLGCIVDAARKIDGVVSSGERVVLHAALAAADFAWLADELAGAERHWDRIASSADDVRRAVAAAVLRLDE